MKKYRFFALILSLLMLLQALLPAARAEEDAEFDPAYDEAYAEDAEEAEDAEDAEDDGTAEAEVQPGLPPELVCKGAILMELNSDSTVFEYNADARLFPASLTKIMTCMLALEHGNLSDEVTVDGSLIEGMDEDASTINLVDGETMSLEEMLYAVMVPSANDASIVVAAHIAGTVEKFVEMMNAKAQELGCTGTHFVNPDGLHDENHYTTPRDMAVITKAALQSETFRTICATSVHELPETNASAARMVYTTNYFMSTIITPDYYWEKVSGVKTGFTTPAGRCLVSLVEEGDYSYLSVVMGCETPEDADGSPIYGSFTESRKLLEYGLDNFRFAAVLSHLNPIAQVPVSSGAVKSVVVAPVDDVKALLPKDYEASRIKIEHTLTGGEALAAPLKADEVVGTATVTYEGRVVGRTDIRTVSAVERNKILATPTKDDPAFLRLVPVVIIVVALILLFLSWRSRRRTRRRRR